MFRISKLTERASSEKMVEYRLDAEFVFVNESDYVISFPISNYSGSVTLVLESNESDTIKVLASRGFKNLNPTSCCQGILTDIYGARDSEGAIQLIRLDDNLCVTHLNEKSVIISNYTSEIISERDYRYIYKFTNNDFLNANECE